MELIKEFLRQITEVPKDEWVWLGVSGVGTFVFLVLIGIAGGRIREERGRDEE